MESLPATAKRIEDLIKQREDSIVSENVKERSAWIDLFREMDTTIKLKTDIVEAKEIGEECRFRGEKILDLFIAASKLRYWSHKLKLDDHSKEKTLVDRAVEEFHKLKVALLRYEDELEDIYGQRNLSLISPIGKFDNFIDVYHNYLINDWIIRNRISSVISMIEALLDEVSRLYQTIERKEWETNQQIKQNEVRRKELLRRELG